jgi:hypothetical protein
MNDAKATFPGVAARHDGVSAMHYDSTADTDRHIAAVRTYLRLVIDNLERRSQSHDASKKESPEKEVFDEFTPKLSATTYGSDEYMAFLSAMKPALDHHYSVNSHHPEHYANGIEGMNLLDLVEMFCDWKAATLRHNDGDLKSSIKVNQKRFGYSDELRQILLNTANELML